MIYKADHTVIKSEWLSHGIPETKQNDSHSKDIEKAKCDKEYIALYSKFLWNQSITLAGFMANYVLLRL